MKHIIQYKLFESSDENINNIIDSLNDILLELKDEKKHELHKKYFLQNIEGSKLFFINGIFIPELSELIDENGLEIKSIKNDSI